MKGRIFSEERPAPKLLRVLLVLVGFFLEGFCLILYLGADWNSVSTILALLGALFIYAGIQKGKNFALEIFGLMIELIVGAVLGTLKILGAIVRSFG